jgi:MFS family permease
VIGAGGACLTAGMLALALAADSSIAALAPGLALAGAGIGLCFTPLTSTVLADIDPAKAGGASGALSTVQQIGFALGVAVTGVIYFAEPDPVRAFTLSLIQLAVPAAAIVLSAPRLRTRVAATVTA